MNPPEHTSSAPQQPPAEDARIAPAAAEPPSGAAPAAAEPPASPAPAERSNASASAPDQPGADAPAERRPARPPRDRRRQQGRAGASAQAGQPAGQNAAAARAPGGSRRSHPLLLQLQQWHPQLFGAQPLPLKRGIFHDLLAAHGEAITKDDLKQALALHTRSTRYLTAVASGQQRHDLSGQPVEALAPEHIHHALLEVFRRRKPRDGEDLQVKLRRRIAQAFEASGLAREDYDALVRGRDEKANALLDEAFAEVAERDARAEALLRAFEAGGATPEHFADMYGMDRREVTRQLERARRLRASTGG